MTGRRGLLSWVGMALLATACVSPGQRREESLQKVAHEFNDGLRWGRDDQVLRCLPPAEARRLQARRADLGEDFVVADHEVTSILMAAGADKATVIAVFSWFNQRRGVVQKSTVEEKWEWLEGRWWVMSQRRIAGEHFPLVPERIDAQRDPSP